MAFVLTSAGCRIGDCVSPKEYWARVLKNVDFDLTPREGVFVYCMKEKELFDAPFFGLLPKDARVFVPSRKLLLEVAWETIERSGWGVDHFMGKPYGSFTGSWEADYHPYEDSAWCAQVGLQHGDFTWFFGITGVSLVIDSACSSSMCSLFLAMNLMQSNELCGSFVSGSHTFSNFFAPAALAPVMSRTGRCRSFDASADGYSQGEGTAVLLLERAEDACVASAMQVLSCYANNDGNTKRRYVPGEPGQTRCLKKSLEIARVDPSDIGVYEAQATATVLADATETKSLCSVYGSRRAPILLQSIKTFHGHTEPASGVFGLLKTFSMLSSQVAPAHLHMINLSPFISISMLESSAVCIPKEEVVLPGHFISAESHFGLGGTNAHALLKRITLWSSRQAQARAECVIVSNRTTQGMADAAKRHLKVLRETSLDLVSYCTTPRKRFQMVLVVTGRSCKDFAAGFQEFLDGSTVSGLGRVFYYGKQPDRAASLLVVCGGRARDWEAGSPNELGRPLGGVYSALRFLGEMALPIRYNGSGRALYALGAFLCEDVPLQEWAVRHQAAVAKQTSQSWAWCFCASNLPPFPGVVEKTWNHILCQSDLHPLVDLATVFGVRVQGIGLQKVEPPTESLLRECEVSLAHKFRSAGDVTFYVGKSFAMRAILRPRPRVYRLPSPPVAFSFVNSIRLLEFASNEETGWHPDVPTYSFQQKDFHTPQPKLAPDAKSLQQVFMQGSVLCAFCETPIASEKIVVDGAFLHEKCVDPYDFLKRKCALCSTPLCEDGVDFEGKRYHKSCYETKLFCGECRKALTSKDIQIEIDGMAYHAGCQVTDLGNCSYCRERLTQDFMWFNGKRIHCGCLKAFREAEKDNLRLSSVAQHLLVAVNAPAPVVPVLSPVALSVISFISNIGGIPKEEIMLAQRLDSFGVGSVDVMKLRLKVEQGLGVSLPPTYAYDFETLGELVRDIESRGGAPKNCAPVQGREQRQEILTFFGKHTFLRGLVQFLLSIVLVITIVASIGPSILFGRLLLNDPGQSFWTGFAISGYIVLAPLSFFLSSLMLMVFTVMFKWILIGSYREGIYPSWGHYFFRWWFVRRLYKLVYGVGMSCMIRDSVIGKLFHLSTGAKIAWGSHYAAMIFEPDLVRVGRRCGLESSITCAVLRPTFVELKSISVGDGAWVGSECVIEAGVSVKEGSLVADMTYLDRTIENNAAVVTGCPAKVDHSKKFTPNTATENVFLHILRTLLCILLQSYMLGLMVAPSVILFNIVAARFSSTWLAVGSLVLLMPLMLLSGSFVLICLKWLILWRVKPGNFSMYGFLAFRKSLVDSLGTSFFRVLLVFWNYAPWMNFLLRFLGADVSMNAIIGYNPEFAKTSWDVVSIGDGCFVGPLVVLKTWRYENDSLVIASVRIGDACSVGTFCVIQGDSTLESGSHLSSCSCAHTGTYLGILAGNPAVSLNKRALMPPERVYFFPWYDYIVPVFFQMWFWAILTCFAAAGYAIVSFWLRYCCPPGVCDATQVLLLFWAALGFSLMTWIFGYPWVVMPLYRMLLDRRETILHPNWMTSLTNLMESFLVIPQFVWGGTQVMVAVYNSWGADIGRGTYIDSPFFFDQNRIQIGQNSVIEGIVDLHGPNKGWSMVYGSLRMGDFATLERGACASLSLEAERGAIILPLSRVAPGEHVFEDEEVVGSPMVRGLTAENRSKVA